MPTSLIRFAAVLGTLLAISTAAAPARADLPGFPGQPCPSNTSCAPGTPTPPSPPVTCGPGNGGSTCGGDGPATLASGTGVNVGAGNPINVINGDKYQREVDMAALPGTLGLEIVRHYNSTFSRPNASTNLIGRGWKLSYETDLYAVGRTVQIVQADGSRIIFSRDPRDPSLCASDNPANGSVSISKTARGDEYVWRWTNGRTLSFDSRGKLVQILAPNGQFVTLQHDSAGLLVKVTDPQGRSLNLSYLDKAHARAGDAFGGVRSIASPVGRFTYHYGSPMPKGAQIDRRLLLANLTGVDMPTGRRYYHYEDAHFPTLLTGISELATDPRTGHLAWQRLSTYGYGPDGKGILSVRGARVTLDFSKGGETTVTNERGQRTVFRHAVIGGEYRLLEVRGPGCADCGPTNVRYRYDGLGRLAETTTLDAAGMPLAGMRTDFDARGRPLMTSKIAYRDGRSGAPQWQTRFEYTGASMQPTRVFRPSVVAGKEAVVTTAYADSGPAAGLPLSVTEDGFAPSSDARVPTAAITRTTRYRYDGYGERVETDGPLPNAPTQPSPANSDLTRTEFDPTTKLPVRTRHPGNRIEEVLERDAALRPRVVRITDGPVVRTIAMTLNWRGQPEQVEVTGAAPVRYRYDVNGRPLDGGDSNRANVQAASGASAGAAAEHDWLSRPVAWSGGGDTPFMRVDWGASGSAAQASVLAISAGDAHAERMLDDFGRVVAIRNPGQGWQLAQYDAAGRIVDSLDPRGARQHAQWDVAGRLLKLVRYAPGAMAPEQTLTYRYAGPLPLEQQVADADGTRLSRSDYDAQGRIVRQTLSIVPSSRIASALAAPVTMRYGWRYDAHGRLATRTFTDSAGAAFELDEQTDAHGLTSRIATRGALPAALGGGRAIASGIGWKQLATGPFADRIVHGDGSVDQFDIAPSSTQDAGPRYRQVSMELGDKGTLRQSPGRNPDAAGLPAAITTAAADQQLEWNAAGQLARSVRAGGDTRYLYDANRQRVARIVTDTQGRATASLFFYHDRRLVAEADARGQMQYAYAYLGWRPLAQLDLRPQSWWGEVKRWLFGAPVRHLHTSRTGRVTDMTDDGATVWSDADPAVPQVLRAASVSFSAVHQPLRYVGQVHDEDSGLDYHGARYFDPGSGRFLSPDPAGVVDALNGVPAARLLDLYAYAGGQPDEFFDPDGAARIRYFAITTDAKGNALGMDQGFTQARWAFVIDNIKAGGDGSALGQKRNQYAQGGTSLLVDVGGDFLAKGQSAATWEGGAGIDDMFTTHYGDKLISIPEFTINDMNDDDAARMIASYIDADRKAVFNNSCPARAMLLPQIKFAAEEPKIDVTNPTANGGHKERILPCGEGSASNIGQRRIATYEAAAEINETARINRDCSKDGCPGIAYYCDATKCHAADQLIHGAPNTSATVYTPSYGRSQFIGSTLVTELLNGYSSFTGEVRTQLGLDAAMKQALEDAALRGQQLLIWFKNAHAAASYAEASQAWANLSASDRAKFTSETGLGQQAYIDLVRMKTNPPTNSKGKPLLGDAKQGLVTAAIMSDTKIQNFLMGIFKDFDKFTLMGNGLMNKNLQAALRYRPNAPEKYLAAMVARAHNGGTWRRDYDDLVSADEHDYVKNFLGITPLNTKKGDWNSLRCTESFGPDTLKPGKQGKGIGGLEMQTLKLN